MAAPSKTTTVSARAIVLREVFGSRGRFGRVLLLAFASLMHAAGHAALALLGGEVVIALGGAHPASHRSSALDAAPLTLAMAAAFASSVRAVGNSAGAYLAFRIAGDVSTTLRGRVLDALLKAPLGNHLRRPGQRDHGRPCALNEPAQEAGVHAKAVAALTLRIREVVSALEASLVSLRASLQLLFLAGVIVFVAPKLFIIAAAVLAPFAWLLGKLRRRLRAVQREEMRGTDLLLEAADEAARFGELWRSYGAGRRIAAHLARLGDEARDRAARLAAFSTAQSSANELLGVIAFTVALAALARYSPGDASRLAPFAVPFFLAYRPLRDLAEAKIVLARADEAARDLDDVLAAAPRPTDDVAMPLESANFQLQALELSNVVHPHAAWSPLSLRIEPGTIVALVGRTGVGKTTLLRILLGLEPPGGGEIKYGDRAITRAHCGPSARPFAWVPQEAPVLAASLEENILLGEASDRNPRGLLALLGAESLLELAPHERLGASHRPLSGGERQWLSLARALASTAPVLLLDEPTSGLDPQAEERVLRALASLRGTRTIVIVTHREATAAIADRVIHFGGDEVGGYFGGGRVVSATTGLGTHWKLSSKTLEL